MGEIYEKGLGTTPDFAKAASWYRKAADQGHARAQFNLGTLYEQGLGVEKDALQALNLYRSAGGLEGDVGYEEAYRQELERQRTELEKAIDERDAQIEALEQQVDELEGKLETQGSASAELTGRIASLNTLLAQLRRERDGSQARLTSLLAAGTNARTVCRSHSGYNAPHPPTAATPRQLAGLGLGRYYALVIGNQNYRRIEPLVTPLNDARRAARVLKDVYGFSVTVVDDADDVAMLRALNDLNGVLKPEDNLLIYYAGHGTRLRTGDREAGYWLPVNADPPPVDTFWVANEQVTGHLARLPARRVLVVADSCYAGLLSDDPSFLMRQDASRVSLDYVRIRLPKRARLLDCLGRRPARARQGGQGNSVFARAFLDALEANRDVLSAPALFARLKDRVKTTAARTGFPAGPRIQGHQGGRSRDRRLLLRARRALRRDLAGGRCDSVRPGRQPRATWTMRALARRIGSLMSEIRRRGVFRIVAAYAVVAWGASLAATSLLPTFGAPPWAARAFIICAFLGLPIAALLAWVYEITTGGIVRDTGALADSAVGRDPGRQPQHDAPLRFDRQRPCPLAGCRRQPRARVLRRVSNRPGRVLRNTPRRPAHQPAPCRDPLRTRSLVGDRPRKSQRHAARRTRGRAGAATSDLCGAALRGRPGDRSGIGWTVGGKRHRCIASGRASGGVGGAPEKFGSEPD